ncbi:hypothetical protein GIB67_006464 [Kingdonia uniflora]|uniref:Uncharacterized protein n=1 Tax=Kingdonia uniflora TaxID=39325 RepID=A0A7J7LEM7_9MAGN|nr:hypothetical protein GIB67_006464 [Kingdonia uniflora]
MMNKFCGYYAQVVNRDPSGTTDADKVALAHKMYKRIEKKKLKLDHCWEQLKHHKKWDLEVEKKKREDQSLKAKSNIPAEKGKCRVGLNAKLVRAYRCTSFVLCFDWDIEISWCSEHFKGKLFMAQVRKLTFCAFISRIWGERNNRIFEIKSKPAVMILHNIINDVRIKLSCSDITIKDTDQNRVCLQEWNLPNRTKITKPIFCSWTKPPPVYPAINTYGSLSEVGGFGAIVRTEEEISVKAVAGRVRVQSTIIHELQGIETGLLLGLKLEIN